MSATNRGAVRAPSDNYPTPSWATAAFVRWAKAAGLFEDVTSVLDPCAGDGSLLQTVRETAGADLVLCGLEIRPECEGPLRSVTMADGRGAAFIANALVTEFEVPRGAAVITNPPYGQAQEFIQLWAPRVAWSAWLLRLNFLGSQKRAAWFRTGVGRPSHVLILPKRPSFTGGSTDSCEYAWIVWPGYGVRYLDTRVDWLV